MTRWCQVGLRTLLLTLATIGLSADSPKRVLVLNPYGREVAPVTTVISSFRSTLARELGAPVDIYELPLELERFAEPDGASSLAAFLEGRIKEQSFDIVVPVASAGMQFAAKHRDRLFPNTPILVLAAEPRLVSPDLLRTNVTLVTQSANLPGMVEDILQIQPQTTNIVVVFGASTLERFWTERCRREFQVFTNKVRFTWVNDLTMGQILKYCSALPPNSFVLHAIFFADAAGVPCERNEALLRLHEVANAPVFGYYASEFGLGPIGGRLYQDSEVGAQGARTAIRILRGEKPERIPALILDTARPTYDWRELQRWGISEARLPAGSVIQFRQPSFWERYRWPIAGTVTFCLLQAALIIGLLVNRAKRRQGEAEATLLAHISSKFVNLPPGEVDREIMDAERRLCDLLGLEVSSLWQWLPEAPEVLTLTHLYRLVEGPPTPEKMTAAEYFPWCQHELRAGRIVILSSLEGLPAEAARDRETFGFFGIKSGLVLPLSAGGGPPVGALSFGTVRAERDWPDALVKRLQPIAEIFTNALARKRADQALRASEERMTLAADSARFGVWVWNLARNQVWGSERWLGLFGFVSGQDVSFQAVIERIHPDDRETVEREVRQALANRSDYAGEFRAFLPDGTQRWIASRGRGYPDTNGTPARMMGAAIDITERKRAEEALLTSYAEIERLKDRLQAESDYLKAEVKVTQSHGEVIGRSAVIHTVLAQAEQVGPTDSSVLISGETGTGKELVAQTIHRLSSRGSRVMVMVNCAALPAALVESELFGREKGAYTGALMRQIGRFELADGSTIFLDEVGELSLEVQAKLLRVLQEGQFERLGSPRTMKVNVRIIGATNRDLREEVRKGRFREDLYYRLNVFPIRVPPLRERAEDIPLLVWAFLEELSSRMGRKITRVPRKTMEMLQRHSWPGNVRELRNVIEHSVIITTGETLRVPMLEHAAAAESVPAQTLTDYEREHIMKALEQTGWRIKGPRGSATLLGLNPSTLYGRMRKLGIPGHRHKDQAVEDLPATRGESK